MSSTQAYGEKIRLKSRHLEMIVFRLPGIRTKIRYPAEFVRIQTDFTLYARLAGRRYMTKHSRENRTHTTTRVVVLFKTKREKPSSVASAVTGALSRLACRGEELCGGRRWRW